MDEAAICELLRPLVVDLTNEMREAFGDFDEIVTPDARPTILQARAKVTNCRLIHWVASLYGRDPSQGVRVQEIDGMDVLYVVGTEFDVGLRLKKFDGHYQTYNHRSQTQDALRQTGRFDPTHLPETTAPLAHVFLGYRCTAGLAPRLRDVGFSFERQTAAGRNYVSWHRVLWTPDDGFDPRQTFTPDMFPPDMPNYDLQPRRDGTGGITGDERTG